MGLLNFGVIFLHILTMSQLQIIFNCAVALSVDKVRMG
jgi:hypothetical protein